jgi:transcriptional regulator with XRE-family HTH domain
LRHWRALRGISQQDLAEAAETSTRHLSFLETGRAHPSLEMVNRLCTALQVPAPDRNVLLQAAGFAPLRRSVDLSDPSMAATCRALELILKRHEPFGAVVVDRRWDILMVNEGYARFLSALGQKVPAYFVTGEPRVNWLRILFSPGKVREVIANWPEVAAAIRARVAREEPELAGELGGGIAMPPALDVPLIPIHLRIDGKELGFMVTVSSLGTALDAALQQLKIKAFHPFDDQQAGTGLF